MVLGEPSKSAAIRRLQFLVAHPSREHGGDLAEGDFGAPLVGLHVAGPLGLHLRQGADLHPISRRSTGRVWPSHADPVAGRHHQNVPGDQPGFEGPPAGPAVGARPSRDTRVAVDVVLGHTLLTKLVGKGLGVAAGGSLDALPAGPDVAVGRQARTIPLCDGLAQWEEASCMTVT